MTGRRLRSWWRGLRDRDPTGTLPVMALANVFWLLSFVGTPLRGWRLLAMVLLGVLSMVMFTLTPLVVRRTARVRTLWFVLYLLPFGLLALLVSWQVLFLGAYVCTAAVFLLPLTTAVGAVLVTGGAMCWGARTWHQDVMFTLALMAMFANISTAVSIRSRQDRRRLLRAEQRNAVLAVAAERARIGRDLHDILGHSLTAIAVKGDLAARLVDRDPDAAKAQLAELVAVARQALADTRSTASGLREVRVATEIASARSVLESAGIQALTPSALPVLDDATAELFGYVVREGVTNVVRHSGAHACTIEVDEHSVRVLDDGAGVPAMTPRMGGSTASSGVSGLRSRAAELGYRVHLRREGDHTVLTCTTGPEEPLA